jgi:xanthine dehydrogenase accessory factor
MKQLATWKFIRESFDASIPVMLMYVLESVGSSPGRQGFAMAVNAKGAMEGSLGGGIMEHKFVEMAKARLAGTKTLVSVHKQVHDKSAPANQSGMICSGEQTILLYEVQPGDIPAIDTILQALAAYERGTVQLDNNGIAFSINIEEPSAYHYKDENNWSYKETIGIKDHLYIVGGGHCALAFSRLMNTMDFYISIYETRPELNTLENNSYVHEKHILTDYSELAAFIPPSPNAYVVLMTFGYRTDHIALRAIMHNRYRYLGVLGSRKKIEKMFNDYRNEGISDETLKAIHAPIGIPIKSETPEEIAVSIAAEIIKVRKEH